MSHIYCPECGFQNPESANFCSKCGARLIPPDESESTMTFTPEEGEEMHESLDDIGVKVFDERGWAQVLPDPDEPVVHLYAEGETRAVSDELAEDLRGLVDEILQGDEAAARI